jgi:hypothetical protein
MSEKRRSRKQGMLRIRLLCLCLLLCPAAFGAGDEHRKSIDELLAAPVTVDFSGTDVGDAVDAVFRGDGLSGTGLRYVTDLNGFPKNPEPIRLAIENEPVAVALDQLAKQIDAEYLQLDGVIFFYKKGTHKWEERIPAISTEAKAALTAAVWKLGDADFEQREDATKTIEAIGLAAIPPLKDSLLSIKDPEAVDRIKNVTKRIQAQFADQPPDVSKELETWRGWYSLRAQGELREIVSLIGLAQRRKISVDPRVEKLQLNVRSSALTTGIAMKWLVRLAHCRLVVEEGELRVSKGESVRSPGCKSADSR